MKRTLLIYFCVLSMTGTPLLLWIHAQSKLRSAYRVIALQQRTITQLQTNAVLWKLKYQQSIAANAPRR